MQPAARRERADISLASNPRFGPQKPTEVLRVFKIMVGFVFFSPTLQSHDAGW